MEIQINLSNEQKKVDGVFYQAFQKVYHFSILTAIVEILKLITFVVLIPINLLTQNIEYGNLIECFIVNAVASGVGLLFELSLIFCIMRSVGTFLKLAYSTNHIVQNQIAAIVESKQSCVSTTIYVAENQVKYEDVNQEVRKNYVKVTKNTLNNIIRTSYPWLKNFEDVSSVFSFSTMVFSIYVLIKQEKPAFDTVLLIFYVVVVAYAQLTLIVVCIFIALSPLICIGLIFFCCCSGEDSSGQFINITSREATNSDLVNSGGECSICMMTFGVGSKVFVLPCSEKHVFHTLCLRQWAKVKNTCPICRGQIPMTSKARESQTEENQSERAGQE